jgi:transposase-like protein
MEWRCSLKGAKKARSGKPRVHTPEFKLSVVQRMLAGEPVARLSREVKVKREMLYRWRDAYRKHGRVGLERPPGRPRKKAEEGEPATAARLRELERKVGQQALVIDFLQRACKRVKELRQESKGPGATASMERSKP